VNDHRPVSCEIKRFLKWKNSLWVPTVTLCFAPTLNEMLSVNS